jgi:predicted ArsR family transcriptional regulator
LNGGCDMLQRILELAAQGGVRSQTKLAEELGVSDVLIGQMIDELAQMGYLVPATDDCGDICSDCRRAMTCTVGGPARIWALTEKGRKAARKD